jgi:signal transduction histidine kinase
MIKKLQQKIFWVVMISLSVVAIGAIVIFAYINCNDTIKTSDAMRERMVEKRVQRDINGRPEEVKVYSETELSEIYEITESHIKQVIELSVLASILSIAIIYIIAKRVAKIIAKPVQETFEKQKQFISDASHELKTPLAVIEANADVLEIEVGNNKWMGYIQNEIESMDKLINELLLLAKIENIDTVRTLEKFDLSKESEVIVSMFESMAYEKNVNIETNLQENIMINGSKEDIKHILSTLIDNAIKHTDTGNKIKVELKKEKNEIELLVKNQGKPIPAEEREKIFERFYRIDKSRNRNEKRYGLGLAIAKSIVQRYNGKIEVNCKDGFTIFKVIIPN